MVCIEKQKCIHTCYYCNGLFSSDVFIEKHWKSIISRSVCDYFFDQHRKAINPEDIPPVIATPHHYLISIYRCGLYFVAVCMTEG
jgi:AP-3 complex subunit mu